MSGAQHSGRNQKRRCAKKTTSLASLRMTCPAAAGAKRGICFWLRLYPSVFSVTSVVRAFHHREHGGHGERTRGEILAQKTRNYNFMFQEPSFCSGGVVQRATSRAPRVPAEARQLAESWSILYLFLGWQAVQANETYIVQWEQRTEKGKNGCE